MGSLPLSSFPFSGTHAVSRVAPQTLETPQDFPIGRCGTQSDPWVAKVSDHKHEREAAFRLVHEVYFRAGLTTTHPLGMRVMKHHLSDHTDILVVKRDDTVVFTSTLVRDGEYGMPLESLFASEVETMRADGLQVAEISCLASDISLQNNKQRFELLVKIISLTLQTAREHGVDRVLLAVHPRHAKVYQRLFGCEICSEVKEYAAVEGNPAVLCMHDFAQLDETRYPLYEQIYGQRYHPRQLAGTRMTEAEKWHFSQAVSSAPEMIPMAA